MWLHCSHQFDQKYSRYCEKGPINEGCHRTRRQFVCIHFWSSQNNLQEVSFENWVDDWKKKYWMIYLNLTQIQFDNWNDTLKCFSERFLKLWAKIFGQAVRGSSARLLTTLPCSTDGRGNLSSRLPSGFFNWTLGGKHQDHIPSTLYCTVNVNVTHYYLEKAPATNLVDSYFNICTASPRNMALSWHYVQLQMSQILGRF